MKLRRILQSLFVLGLAAAATGAQAQQYPNRTIKIVIGFGAGGTADAIVRFYAQKLHGVLNNTVIVENKPSAGQVVAIKTMTGSPPDGYTLFIGAASAFGQGPGLRKDLPYDPLKDFTHIALVASAPGVLVTNADAPFRTLREMVNYSIANPNRLNYGSSGVGASSHLQVEYLVSLTGLKITHIPYKSDSDIMRELIAGSIQLGMSPIQGAMQHIASGKVRALSVTGSRRQPSLPEVPSLSESDFKGLEGVDPYSYYGLVGPVGLPPAIVTTLNDAVNRVSRMPDVVAFMQDKLYSQPGTGTPASFRTYAENDLAKWRSLSKIITLPD